MLVPRISKRASVFPVIMGVVLGLGAASSDVHAFATGGVLLPTDQYLALPKQPTYRAFLPVSADLSSWFPKPGSQGEQPSCAAWATTYALMSYYEIRRDGPSSSVPLSPAFVYNQLSQPTGSCRNGLTLPDVLNFLKDKGAPPLAEFGYSDQLCNVLPDGAVAHDAERHRITDWKRLDVTNLDDLKGEIANGYPVVVAMALPHKFQQLKGPMPFDDVSSPDETHAMVVSAYDDKRAAFRLVNSWGTEWGDKGFGWVTYRYFAVSIKEAYSVHPNHSVPPAPLLSLVEYAHEAVVVPPAPDTTHYLKPPPRASTGTGITIATSTEGRQ